MNLRQSGDTVLHRQDSAIRVTPRFMNDARQSRRRRGISMAKSSRFLFAALAATCLTVPAVIHAAPAEKGWPMVEGDLGNSRYSTLDQINAKNIKELGGVWNHKFEGEVSRGTPVVVDGVMYVTAGSHVYAINPKT